MSMILAAILLKMGGYGISASPIHFPEAKQMLIIGIIGW
jgi:NADH:ubiquinone oxidoreductase subunit 4 (subunit M)